MEFRTITEFNNYMEKKIKIVIKEVSNNIYNELINCIQSQIYDTQEGVMYKRNHYNGGFISSFEFPDVKSNINGFVAEIMYNPSNMKSPYDDTTNNGYAHGNASGNVDNRNDLWKILSSSSLNKLHSDFGGAYGVNSKQGYLEKFQKILNNNLQKWIESSCSNQGIPVVNVGKYTTFVK